MNLETLRKISYGLYIICSKYSDKINGQIANALFQVTADPQTIAVSINRKNLTWEYIQASKLLSIAILTKDTPLRFIGQFGFKSGRDNDKLSGVKYRLSASGLPIVLDHTLAYLEAEVVNQVEVATHTIFIAQVKEGEILLPNAEPMTYAYYHDVKRGTSPETAPTYIKAEDLRKAKDGGP